MDPLQRPRRLNALAAALMRSRTELDRLGIRWALIGGMALAVRAEPRQTRDVDLAIAVASDLEAEALVRQLSDRGFRFVESGVLEQTARGRLAAVRLQPPAASPQDQEPVVVDLMFHSSGIEPEVIAAADKIEVMKGLFVPIATRGHLIALKVLAGRDQDLADIANLLRYADTRDLEQARDALELIDRRGCHRGKDLQAALAREIEKPREPGP